MHLICSLIKTCPFPQASLVLIDLFEKDRTSQEALVVKNLPTSAGDVRDESWIPGLGRSHGGGHGNPSSVLFYFLFLYRILLFAIKAQHESAISIHIGPPF